MHSDSNAQRTWLTDHGRVAQLYRALLHSDSVRVHVDGLRQPMSMRAEQVRSEPSKGQGTREYVALRPMSGECVLLPYIAGGGTNVWFSDPAGSYAFRAAGVTILKFALCVPPPLALLRFARRAEPRYTLSEDASAACAPRVAAVGDPEGRPARLLNVSLGGAFLHVTGDEAPPPSSTLKVSWLMPRERRIDLSATVVVARAVDRDRFAVAVQFNASTGTQTTLARFIAALGPTATLDPDVVETLPPAVRAHLETPPLPDARDYPVTSANDRAGLLRAVEAA
jgi:hypothetical protein